MDINEKRYMTNDRNLYRAAARAKCAGLGGFRVSEGASIQLAEGGAFVEAHIWINEKEIRQAIIDEVGTISEDIFVDLESGILEPLPCIQTKEHPVDPVIAGVLKRDAFPPEHLTVMITKVVTEHLRKFFLDEEARRVNGTSPTEGTPAGILNQSASDADRWRQVGVYTKGIHDIDPPTIKASPSLSGFLQTFEGHLDTPKVEVRLVDGDYVEPDGDKFSSKKDI